MVFAERGETISGGNFHGEYPAKVWMFGTPKIFSFLFVFATDCFLLFHSPFLSLRLWTFYLLQSMSWPLSVRGGSKGCVTPLWASYLPSWSMRVDSTQVSWLHIALLLHWVSLPQINTEYRAIYSCMHQKDVFTQHISITIHSFLHICTEQFQRTKFCVIHPLWTPCPPVLPQRIMCPWEAGLLGRPCGLWNMWSKVRLKKKKETELGFIDLLLNAMQLSCLKLSGH